MEISVVICAYTVERWDELVAAVRSAAEQTLRPREVAVVVDHNDALLERVRRELPQAVAVANDEARGLSGARNSGVRAVRGDVVAFLDDDAVAEADWLERLAAGFAAPEVLGVGGAIVPLWIGRRSRAFPDEFGWVVGCSYRGLPTGARAVRNMIGANMSVRRELLVELGGFRSGIGRVGRRPVGCEETELCIRGSAVRPDGVWLYEPRARVHHRIPAERACWRYFFSRCYSEGLSKAVVRRVAGAGRALASERAYTFHPLPAGVARGLADAVRGDPAGLGRAAAIIGGLLATTVGFAVGTARRSVDVGGAA